jgi:hypothetical protein
MKKVPSGGGNGALTTAWITATSETDTTIISALNTLETDLTTYGLTAKIKALYPMVGGTATKHKFNFMDARDLDAAYRLTFFGGGTHSATGYQPNGTNAYANTFLNGNTLTLNSTHISAYSRTNLTTNSAMIGCFTGALELSIFPRYGGTQFLYAVNGAEYGIANTDSRGLFSANRNNALNITPWRNGTKLTTTTSASVALISENITLSALNSTGARYYFGAHELAFASVGSGLTDGEQANLYTAVQAFQTTLSRQI